MAKKKVKQTKKKVIAKKEIESCCIEGLTKSNLVWIKLSTIAFILFLIAVWPALLDLILKVHWGWYLAATIIFALLVKKKRA